ncbi:MAG: D-sedoheptulose 7-phosphate isomerase [Candidatus Eisenbacteria bacterium]|uniref:Phosphoheptose isomerase n=1 Tax=Eiseniibacteriota bacterium TaxID=2212470 RepID=A0A956RR13_UNCEI|nr:D-sedoheptulose 7-phosphate isomerase [Candidatus Eisenbacteria bacterium]
MITTEEIRARIQESIRVKTSLLEQAQSMQDIAACWTEAIRAGHQVIFFGNGGSAADAQHMVCELAGRFYLERKPVAAVSLTVNTSSLTAIGNDYSFDVVFARQLEGAARAGDVAVGLSTSGNSKNVVLALEAARSLGLRTVGFTGRGGGKVRSLVNHWLPIDSDETPRIQEGHILAGHIICELTERELFGEAR